jgi:hypothetical protein
VCDNCAVPKGTRTCFLPYPALRLRLRAGLDCFAPTVLDLSLANSAGDYSSFTLIHSEARSG